MADSIPPPPADVPQLTRADATYPWKQNNFSGAFRSNRTNSSKEAYYITECAKFINGDTDITTFVQVVPYVNDHLFRFNRDFDYSIDVGHYLFRTIRMMTKITDTEQATEATMSFINTIINKFKNTIVYADLIDEIDAYTNDKAKQIDYMSRIFGIIDSQNDPQQRVGWYAYTLFTLNLLEYKRQYS